MRIPKEKEEQDLGEELSYLGLIGPMNNNICLRNNKQSIYRKWEGIVLKRTVEVVQVGKLHVHEVTLGNAGFGCLMCNSGKYSQDYYDEKCQICYNMPKEAEGKAEYSSEPIS